MRYEVVIYFHGDRKPMTQKCKSRDDTRKYKSCVDDTVLSAFVIDHVCRRVVEYWTDYQMCVNFGSAMLGW